MLKEQKVGLFIISVIFITSLTLIFHLIEKPKINELNSLLIPSILFGLTYSSFKLLKKPQSEVYEILSYKDIYYNFCSYYIIGSISLLTMISILYSFGNAYYFIKCWLGFSGNCDFDFNVLNFGYTIIFIIVIYGFSKKIKRDKNKIINDYEIRLKKKQERIEELGNKLRKSVNSKENIVDWEFLDNKTKEE